MTLRTLIDLISGLHFRQKVHAAVVTALIIGIIGMLLWRIHLADESRQAFLMEQFASDSQIMADNTQSLFAAVRNAVTILGLNKQIRDVLAATDGSEPAEAETAGKRAGIEALFSEVLRADGNAASVFFDALALRDNSGHIIAQKSLRLETGPDGTRFDPWSFSRSSGGGHPQEIILEERESSRPCFVVVQHVEPSGKRLGTLLARMPLHAHLLGLFGKERQSNQRLFFLAYGSKFVFNGYGKALAFPSSFENLGPAPSRIPTPMYLTVATHGWAKTSLAVKTSIPGTPFSLVALAPHDALATSAEFAFDLAVASLGILLMGTVTLLARFQTDRMQLTSRLHEQQQAAMLIRRHVDEFKTLFNALPGLAWHKDAEGRFVTINSATCDFFGRPPENILGKKASDLLPADLAESFEQDERKILKGERATVDREMEIEIRGQGRTIVRRMVALMDPDGRVDGIIGLTMDVTQNKLAEKLIAKTSAFQKIILELAINFVNRPIAELDQGVVEALALVGSFCDMDRACLFRYDYALETMSVSHEWCAPDTPSIKSRLQDTPTSLFPGLVEAHRAKKNMSIPNVEGLPPGTPLRKTYETLGAKSVISVPLYNGETCFGFVGFASIRREKVWTEGEINLLVVTAELLTNARLRRQREQHLIEARAVAEEAYDVMEKRIEKRTKELACINSKLKSEIARRMHLIRDLETIQNSISAILIAVDENGEVTQWSNAAEKAFGLNSRDTVGTIFQNLPLPWDWDIVRASVAECVTAQGVSRAGNVGYVNADGQQSILMLTVSPIHDASRGQAGYLILGEDVTEIITLEAQLSQAAKMEAIGQLAAGIAHEINTPTQYVSDSATFLREVYNDLAPIFDTITNLCASEDPLTANEVRKLRQVLRDTELEFMRREIPPTFERIETGIDKISSIVRAMNRFAYFGNDEKRMTDINELLDNALTISQNEWKYVANLTKDFDHDIGCVMCSPGDISQVFLNVIINAAHAVEEKVRGTAEKGTITVSTRMSGHCAEVRISDTGGGIPEHLKDKIFNLFFTTKKIGKGTGQGLAIAYNTIVTKHGGEITFESGPGKGTTFIIRIPMRSDTF